MTDLPADLVLLDVGEEPPGPTVWENPATGNVVEVIQYQDGWSWRAVFIKRDIFGPNQGTLDVLKESATRFTRVVDVTQDALDNNPECRTICIHLDPPESLQGEATCQTPTT